MGVLLYIIATILFFPLTILNILIVLYKNIKTKGFFGVIDDYFYEGAIDIDKFANHNFRTLWNVILRTKGGYEFGNKNETISSALGKNQRDGTLSLLGIGLAKLLDTIDKKHCYKSINENV